MTAHANFPGDSMKRSRTGVPCRGQVEESPGGAPVLFVTAEASPWAKVGGLGDVSGELPRALLAAGVPISLCMPMHAGVRIPSDTAMHDIGGLPAWVGPARVHEWKSEGLQVFLFELPRWFGREQVYGYADDGERFAAFCLSVALYATQCAVPPCLLHLNDWHAAPITMLVHAARKLCSSHPVHPLGKMRTLLTIHSLQYQGWHHPSFCYFFDLGFDMASLATNFMSGFNAMKAGILWADAVSTVSPAYAAEIRHAGGGFGLETVLEKRYHELGAQRYRGILNRLGAQWDPAKDDSLPHPFSLARLTARKDNRIALHRELGLALEDAPVAAYVGRLSEGKGLDVLVEAAPGWLRDGMRLIFLGMGEPAQEALLRKLQMDWPGRVAWQPAFLPDLARRIYGGADFLLMPSSREACGISQQIAMQYGCIPIARKTGGLADTICDGETGFLYVRQNPSALDHAVRRAWNQYRQTSSWEERMHDAMKENRDWSASAAQYADIYGELCCDSILADEHEGEDHGEKGN